MFARSIEQQSYQHLGDIQKLSRSCPDPVRVRRSNSFVSIADIHGIAISDSRHLHLVSCEVFIVPIIFRIILGSRVLSQKVVKLSFLIAYSACKPISRLSPSPRNLWNVIQVDRDFRPTYIRSFHNVSCSALMGQPAGLIVLQSSKP